MSVLGAFHVNTASTASGSGLSPCLSTIFPRYFIESLKDFTFRWFALQSCSFHASKDLIEPINVVFQGRCRYDYVIYVTHHEIPVLLGHSGQSLSHQSLKIGRCIAQAKGHPLPLVQSQFARESGFLSILLPQSDLPEGRTQVQCGEELGITKLREALVYSRYRVRIFYRYRVQVTKVATKPKLPLFLFRHYYPASPRQFRGFYHVVFKQHLDFRSARFRLVWRHPSRAFSVRNGTLL